MKNGSRVKIRKSSRYYGRNESNPTTIGTIIESSSLTVRWDNGKTNMYTRADLVEIVEPTKTIIGSTGSTGFIEETDGIGHYTSFKQTNSLNVDHIAYDDWVEYKLHTEEIIDD